VPFSLFPRAELGTSCECRVGSLPLLSVFHSSSSAPLRPFPPPTRAPGAVFLRLLSQFRFILPYDVAPPPKPIPLPAGKSLSAVPTVYIQRRPVELVCSEFLSDVSRSLLLQLHRPSTSIIIFRFSPVAVTSVFFPRPQEYEGESLGSLQGGTGFSFSLCSRSVLG